jgi:L-amino acid N-acyltransferase YncA
MSQIIIRKLELKDKEQVENIFDLYWFDEFRDHLSDKIFSPEMKWIVAEKNNEIVGVAAFRKAPERMREYTTTDQVVEFYISAVKYKGKGVGTLLRNTRINQSRDEGFSEAVFFSGNTHQDSWEFHDNGGFKRVGDSIAPDGEHGKIWLMKLQ